MKQYLSPEMEFVADSADNLLTSATAPAYDDAVLDSDAMFE